jgi:hypothetical protein
MLPFEIVNKILMMRGTHPVAELFCCRDCGENYDWRYPLKYNYLTNKIYTDYFFILCGDCIYDRCKY